MVTAAEPSVRKGHSFRVVAGALLASVALYASGCAAVPMLAGTEPRVQSVPYRIAVFPVENLSGRAAPLGDIRGLLVDRLAAHGLATVDDQTLEQVLSRHRVRYTAGVERELAKALKEETGAGAVLVPSLEHYDDVTPPRVAVFARLVSTGDDPRVLHVAGAGVAGDEAPGLLGMGLVDDPRALLTRVVDSLATSLAAREPGAESHPTGARAPAKFAPKIAYRSAALDARRTYSVAVVPFFNKSARKYAGEIVSLHMIRSLMASGRLAVVEPGVVRAELLRSRVIMTDGISLSDTDTILNAVDADLVLNGEVLEYREPRGSGSPRVDFSVLVIERTTRRVVYSASSHNAGDDRVFFFDWGRVATGHALTAQMSRAVTERMLSAPATPAARRWAPR
ncbi:MAG: hypothetical protein HYU51_06430 [Candidatus Rokubacteria bacterium]|nr:hypothetical protein [Candidatus Rokubacteria bacterium]